VEKESDTDVQIAHEALSRPPEQRSSYLETACNGDSDLRQRVNTILARLTAHTQDDSTLGHQPSTADRPAGLLGAAGALADGPGAKIGHYKLLQLIGEGGFGSVYMAEQLHPVRRKVALKIIKLGMDTRQVIARFEAERQALAMMDHPNIAKVLDAGATDTGRPYFVMELVKGVPITQYCDTNNVSTRERLELFVQVCRAVQHAHQKGIIHRDIKPTNILVTMADGIPIPKVIDFGIAKATQSPLTDKTLFTEYRALVGTPEYMSPEQAEMAGIDIDTRSDIYSLGVLLYELLTGTTPFDAKDLRSKGAPEIQRIIREVDPPKPSTRLSSLATVVEVAHHRSTDPVKLNRIVRGELDWIVMRCLEKDRTRRYETANMLASDVTRYLRDEPISAGPPGTAYQLKKLARRHKWPLAMAAGFVAVLVLGIIGTTVGMIRANSAKKRAVDAEKIALDQKQSITRAFDDLKKAREDAVANANRAEREAAKATAVSGFLQSLLSGRADAHGSGREVRVADLLDLAATEIDAKFRDEPELRIALRVSVGDAYQSLGLYDAARDSYFRALEISRMTTGITSVETLSIAGKYSFAMTNLSRGSEGLEFAKQTYYTALKTLGETHFVTQNAASNLGLLLLDNGELPEAEKIFRELTKQATQRAGTPPKYPPGSGRFFNNMALVLQAQKKYPEAEAMQRQAIEIIRAETNSASGIFGRQGRNLATILSLQRKYQEAEEAYKQTLADQRSRLGEEHPDTQETVDTFAQFLVSIGRPAEADFLRTSSKKIAEQSMSVRMRPRDPAAYLARGRVYANLGQFKDAAADFEKAMKLGPSDPRQVNADEHWSWYLYGATMAYLNDQDAYRKHCRKLVDNWGNALLKPFHDERSAKICFVMPNSIPDLAPAMTMANRAVAMASPGADVTLEEFADEKEANTVKPWFFLSKGMGEYRIGRYDEAIKWLLRARSGLKAPAGSATADLFLAMTHHRLGKAPEAKMFYQRAKESIETLPKLGLADLSGPSTGGVENWLICQTVYREAMVLLEQ
jgi:serine/threonine protein kinase/tetratricopeptide (TPR) repeat protein